MSFRFTVSKNTFFIRLMPSSVSLKTCARVRSALYLSDQPAPSNIAGLAQQIHRLDASLLKSAMLEVLPNLFVLAAPEDPVHAADVKGEHVEAIIKLARAQFDVVIVDTPRTLDAVSLRALDCADTVFPVMQLTLPFVRDARRLLEVFRSLEYPRGKIRINSGEHWG